MAGAFAEAGAPSPPHSPHELARLVLGYLEDEECVSAYEEFMKTSPYLRADSYLTSLTAFSLKDILNEYCAFKLYIRSCAPRALRVKLLQCRTLVDMAKVLVAHVDLKKLQQQPTANTLGVTKPGSNFIAPIPQNISKTKECEVCKAIDNIDGCLCKGRQPILPDLFATPFKIDPQQVVAVTSMPLETLVETTQLADLPGTSAAKKKATEKEQPPQSTFYKAGNTYDIDVESREIRVSGAVHEDRVCDQSAASSAVQNKASQGPSIGTPEPYSKSTNIMDCSDNVPGTLIAMDRSGDSQVMQTAPAVRIATLDNSLRQFTSGVPGVARSATSAEAMPDSSTPETSTHVVPHNSYKTYSTNSIIPNPTPTRIVPASRKIISDSDQNIPTSFTSDRQHSNSSSDVDMGGKANQLVCSSSTKFDEPKVTILSNDVIKPIVEDGKLFINEPTGERCALKMLPGKPVGVNQFTQLATSNTIIQVNGTLAYSGQPKFTKEQIMAMPTVILIKSSNANTTPINTMSTVISAATPAAPVESGYKPLTIDVEATSQATNNIDTERIQLMDTTIERSFIASDEIPTATVSMDKVSTPNVPRLVKKSSSTPRRSSHIRVLDFTTPRRIFGSSSESLVEDMTTGIQTMTSIAEVSQPNASVDVSIETTQENEAEIDEKQVLEPVKKTKKDWDADLRSLAVDSEPVKARKKSHRKERKCPGDSSKENDESNNKRKGKKLKKKGAKFPNDKTLTLPLDDPQKANIVKPTINVVTDWKTASKEKNHKAELPVSENVTPEINHRPTTANLPSEKHNLSDLFLQTPIKHMLENLQMETPRFLDPSILEQPISDIKIDNIPTPNFFNTPNFVMTPKPVGATPSSYSSRPTDYSSGGSYYRPDEHDYAPHADFLSDIYPQETKHAECKTPSDQHQEPNDECVVKSSRPRRRCTLKTVSYIEHSTSKDKNSKGKSIESVTSLETSRNTLTSDSSENLSRNLYVEIHEKSLALTKENNKSKEELLLSMKNKKNRTIAALKKKSPMKDSKRKSTNSISKMVNSSKITPRRPTPKVALKKKPSKNVQSKEQTRSKSSTKEKLSMATVVPAPSKSRRKSSTPRKLTTQRFNSDSIDDSATAEVMKSNNKVGPCDTEDELPALRMSSEDGSRDSKCKRVIDYLAYREENDEIIQIKAYIEKSSQSTEPTYVDLIQRGFDVETAKRIERDLLGTPHRSPKEPSRMENENEITENRTQTTQVTKLACENTPAQSKCPDFTAQSADSIVSPKADNIINKNSYEESSQNQNSIVIEGDIELSRCEVDENSENYFCCIFDETQPKQTADRITINDDFALEIDSEDYPGIKIQLNKLTTVLDLPPKVLKDKCRPEKMPCGVALSISEDVPEAENEEEQIETVNAVDSIAHMTPLYTPIKEVIDKHCLEIFDSTLNSLDTPMKPNSPTKSRSNAGEEMDLTPCRSTYSPPSKRKRSESPVESSTKKSRPETQYLPIQNFDIESVLSKLHGP